MLMLDEKGVIKKIKKKYFVSISEGNRKKEESRLSTKAWIPYFDSSEQANEVCTDLTGYE